MRGHFSTPPLLVGQVLDACGYRPEYDLSHLRVLDPACGSGNFLVGVARRLIASGQRMGLSPEAIVALLQRNIWGLDPDPIACFLAEMQVRAVLSEEQLQEEPFQICQSFHIHQADGLALPWGQCENVDLFLANPPYLAAKNSDLSGYHSAHRHGQTDSYLLFLNLALQVVRPNGWIALVLPDSMLARTNAAYERQRLLTETSVYHLWHLQTVFAAHVGAVVIVAQKRSPSHIHQITWVRERWKKEPVSFHSTKTVSQALLCHQPAAKLCYLLGEVQNTLLERLHTYLCESPATDVLRSFLPLREFVVIRRGEELGKESKILMKAHQTDEQEWYAVLRGGGDIRPYGAPTGHHWIARKGITKPLESYLAPKLLVVKSMGRLQAALDLKKHVVLQTLYLLRLRMQRPPPLGQVDGEDEEEDELYFLLALLNSRLLQDYVYILHTAYKWVQPQIEQHVLAHLPIPTVYSTKKGEVIKRAKALMSACSQESLVVELRENMVYEEQERAICALYELALQQGDGKFRSPNS